MERKIIVNFKKIDSLLKVDIWLNETGGFPMEGSWRPGANETCKQEPSFITARSDANGPCGGLRVHKTHGTLRALVHSRPPENITYNTPTRLLIRQKKDKDDHISYTNTLCGRFSCARLVCATFRPLLFTFPRCDRAEALRRMSATNYLRNQTQ